MPIDRLLTGAEVVRMVGWGDYDPSETGKLVRALVKDGQIRQVPVPKGIHRRFSSASVEALLARWHGTAQQPA
jgi:hypothetical protein